MAQINFGLLNTNAPAEIGNSLANAFAQRRQVEMQNIQLEGAKNQNALAGMQMQKARADMDEETAYKNALRGVAGGDYSAAMPQLMTASPIRAMALQKQLTEQKKTQVGMDKDQLDMAVKRAAAMRDAMPALYANPTDENARAIFSRLVANRLMTQEEADRGVQMFVQTPMAGRQDFLKFHMQKADQLLESQKPTEFQRNLSAAGMSPEQQRAALRAKVQKETTHAPAASVRVDNYPNPVAVMGPDGKPRMVQFTKQGNQVETPYLPYNEKSAEDRTKRSTQSRTVLDIIGEAEPLIDKATGSYAGAALDVAGRVIGESTSGAQATAQLKALEGALMMNQPRMEGPQSNMDVELYRQMAAKIGDPVVPAAEKKAALGTVRGLHEKYLGINQPGATARPSLDSFQR